MSKPASRSPKKASRRTFIELLAMAGVGSQVLLQTRDARAALSAAQEAADKASGEAWPEMAYRTLGRTGFRASRLVFGCGASLSGDPKDNLLNVAFENGVNVFDVGYRGYYKNAERNLAPFAKAHRDDIFLISKGTVPVEAAEEVTTEVAERAARAWTLLLDESLRELQTEHVDAYYQMAANNPALVRAEEMYRAFEVAKEAGKVTYLGVSTHENAQQVLEAAIETGWYDLAMIAVTPAGWYDWNKRQILDGSEDMLHLAPLLASAPGGRHRLDRHEGRASAGRALVGWRRQRQGVRRPLRRQPARERPLRLPTQLRLRPGARHGRGQRRHPGLRHPEGELHRRGNG